MLETVIVHIEVLPMKSIILSIVLTCMSVIADAETVSKSLSTDVLEVDCMPGSAICDLTMSDGRVLSIEHGELKMYLEVVPNIKGSDDNPLFIYNDKFEIISLNPKTFGQDSAPTEQPAQQAAEPPYKIGEDIINMGSRDYPIPQTRMLIISKVNGLVIQKVIVNGGNNSCSQFDENTSPYGKSRNTLKMGDSFAVPIGKVCNLVQFQIITNMGSWTHGG
jgi:hypothetical protein